MCEGGGCGCCVCEYCVEIVSDVKCVCEVGDG